MSISQARQLCRAANSPTVAGSRIANQPAMLHGSTSSSPAGGVLVISHLSHFCRSGPGGKRSRIARRRHFNAARRWGGVFRLGLQRGSALAVGRGCDHP
jgi:hypothetical protein